MKRERIVISMLLLGLVMVPGVLAQTNYAAGKPYTSDPPLRIDWLGDSGGELTDGVTDWSWPTVTGWDGGPDPRAITIDLESVKTDIGSVVITVFVSISSAVPPQASITIFGSTTSATDGFTEWGEATTESTGNEANYIYTWTGGPSAARWVKVVLSSQNPGSHSLLSEIAVLKAEVSGVDDWALYE